MQQVGSPAADPLFSPTAKMPANNPKPQPTLASFFGAKPRAAKPAAATGTAPAAAVSGAAAEPSPAGPGEELVGSAVEIFWEGEEDWYSGTVLSFTQHGGHVISYEDESVVTHDLSQMKYRACPPTEPQNAGAGGPAQSEAVAAAEPELASQAGGAAPPALAAIFGTAKRKTAGSLANAPVPAPMAKTKTAAPAAPDKAAAVPLASIFGKSVKKRPASPEVQPRKSSKPKRDTRATKTEPTEKVLPEKPVAASETAPIPKATRTHDMFLTKKQKHEKEERLRKLQEEQVQEESLRKLREEQERNRRDDEALNKGKASNPFFEKRQLTRESLDPDGDSQLSRCDASSPVFATIPWLLPGGVVHVSQRNPSSSQSARSVLRGAAPKVQRTIPNAPDMRLLNLDVALEAGRGDLAERMQDVPPVSKGFMYHPLDETIIEEFARSLPVISVLCGGESKEYQALKRSDKILVNTFQRCLSSRFGRVGVGVTSEAPRSRLAHELWCMLYRPTCATDVCGNREDVTRLATWLQRMKANMMTAKTKPKASKYKHDSDSEYESDNDFVDTSYAQLSAKDQSELWETSTDYNVVLLTGPAGCGKSAAIHAASQQCGYQIIEMNASEKRSGKAIQGKCGEATQSHGLQKWQGQGQSTQSTAQELAPAATKGKIGAAVAQKRKKKADSKLSLTKKPKTGAGPFAGLTGKSAAAAGGQADGPEAAEASLIVFEEIDILFDDDAGFFGALSALEATTKRPIVLTSTSNSVEGLPVNLPTLNSEFQAPSPKEIRDLLRCICLAEGVNLQPAEAKQLVGRFKNDMRALLMDVQMRFQGECGLLVRQASGTLSKRQSKGKGKAKQNAAAQALEPVKVELSLANVLPARDANRLPALVATSDSLAVLGDAAWSVGCELPSQVEAANSECDHSDSGVYCIDGWLQCCTSMVDCKVTAESFVWARQVVPACPPEKPTEAAVSDSDSDSESDADADLNLDFSDVPPVDVDITTETTAVLPSASDMAACSSLLKDIAELGSFFSATDAAYAAVERVKALDLVRSISLYSFCLNARSLVRLSSA